MQSRRKFLKRATGVVVGATVGMPLRAPAQAPAIAKGTRIHYLKSSELVPAADDELRSTVAEFGKQAGVSMAFETVNPLDLQPRLIAGLQSGNAPDVVRLPQNGPRLFASSLVDVSSVAEPLGKREGGFYEQGIADCRVGQEWKAVPFVVRPVTTVWNVQLLEKIGERVPTTWDEYARTVTAASRRGGFSFGWTFARDAIAAPGFLYPLLWSFGGRETDRDGKKVAINSKETKNAVSFVASLWKQVGTPDSLSWNPPINRELFLAERTIATIGTGGLYLGAKTVKPEIANSMRYTHLPNGPGGVFHRHVTQAHGVITLSKNGPLAQKFVEFLMTPDRMLRFLQAQNAASVGPTKAWETSKLWHSDQVTAGFQTIAASGREVGFPGPPGSAASEVLTKFVIVEMFAKALQGIGVDEAVQWAANELTKIHAR